MSTFINTKDRIKSLAIQQQLTLAELERKLDISNGTIGKWDKRKPNSEPLEKVANFFNVSTDYLLGRTDQKELLSKNPMENGHEANLTIQSALDSVMSYDGEPLTDNDREILKGIIEGYLNSKK